MTLFDRYERCKIEANEKWLEIIDQIPFIPINKLPKDAQIKIIPPHGGAISRFIIADKNDKVWISVYLDFYDVLGWMKEPYYELYPNLDDDCSRFLLNEVDEMCKEITKIYKKQLKTKKVKND